MSESRSSGDGNAVGAAASDFVDGDGCGAAGALPVSAIPAIANTASASNGTKPDRFMFFIMVSSAIFGIPGNSSVAGRETYFLHESFLRLHPRRTGGTAYGNGRTGKRRDRARRAGRRLLLGHAGRIRVGTRRHARHRGLSGGAAYTAHYDLVSTGTTGHAESVDVTYDPSKVSFEQLLDVYFLVAHDPTELNYQGPDEGTQYRSEIYYTTAQQRDEAQRYIASLEKRKVYPAPIVTKLAPLSGFYPAEDYHQDYLVHNPDSPYIVYNDIPKLRALKSKFPNLVDENAQPMRVIAKQ
jgi:methionine-S-sulfoxide reductase